jgi:nicotinamidase/pyrazinamidase
MQLTAQDALLIVDVQNDFLSHGALAVAGGDEIIPVLNGYIALFVRLGLPVIATRDWHSEHHCSFKQQGGIWPPHCIAGSMGAQFPAQLKLPAASLIVSKARSDRRDAYSGFDRTNLASQLRLRGVKRLLVGGLATDYCVFNTVKDALAHGFEVLLLTDAIRAVEVKPGDGQRAIQEMMVLGAAPLQLAELGDACCIAGSHAHI